MSGSYLLDTNVLIALFAQDPNVQERFAREDEVCVSVVALGELFYGAEKSSKRDVNLDRLEAFAAESRVLACGLETARVFGRLKRQLREKGRPIPINDLWIAATAVEQRLTLVTRDQHFSEIDGLTVASW
jgi:tRNA(fMet)-specific endonuclease VapC